jgi:hypothetical protein
MHKICTIVASNYLAQARVLVESVRRIYSNIEIYVLVIDGVPEDSRYLEGATLVLPIDLKMPETWLLEMRSYYDAMELSTSLKPFLLKYLLSHNTTTVTYIDPDVMLFDEIQEGIDAAVKSGIALTPHRLTPAPSAFLEKTEINFLKFGIFNLGYISVSQKALPMLNWWCERLRFYCTKFPGYDVFTDQKWMNFIPAYFDYSLIKSKGYNLASWNLDERDLHYVDDKLYAGVDKLVFIHFAQMSGKLSKGQETKNWRDTILELDQESKSSLDIIEGITKDYSAKLIKQQGQVKLLEIECNREKISTINYHSKKLAIKAAMSPQRSDSTLWMRIMIPLRFLVPNKFSLLLERSSGLNGLRDGLRADIAKIVLKVKREQ